MNKKDNTKWMENEDYGLDTMFQENVNEDPAKNKDPQEQENVETSNQDNDSESDTSWGSSSEDSHMPGEQIEGNPHPRFSENLSINSKHIEDACGAYLENVEDMKNNLPNQLRITLDSISDEGYTKVRSIATERDNLKNSYESNQNSQTPDLKGEREILILDNEICNTLLQTVSDTDRAIRFMHAPLLDNDPRYNATQALIDGLRARREQYSEDQFKHISYAEGSTEQPKRTSIPISDLILQPETSAQPEQSLKRTREESEQAESSGIKKQKTGSLIEDFADVSTELPDYIGGDD